MGKLTSYLFFIILIFTGIYAIHFFEVSMEEEHPGTTDLTLETDLHLNNARIYIKERSIDRSLFHLQKAIESIESVEKISDSLSIEELEYALWDLRRVAEDIENGTIQKEHMNHSFILALNSVATAQLRLSEKYLAEGDEKDAAKALKYASEHLHNALNYVNNNEKFDEIHAYRHIDSLVHSNLDSAQIIEIESAIGEIQQIE